MDTWCKIRDEGQMCLKGRKAILDSIPSKGTYLEYGSGGSTLWFIEEIVKRDDGTKIISVEHDGAWYKKINSVIPNGYRKNFTYIHRPVKYNLTLTDNENNKVTLNPYATPFEENPAGLHEYIHPETVFLSKIDTILIDGIARGPILAYIVNQVPRNCNVFLHDIENRDWYDWAISLYSEKIYVYHNMLRLVI